MDDESWRTDCTWSYARGIVARGFLFNHIYHHRDELVVLLRATGNKVPGMYGPTYEDG